MSFDKVKCMIKGAADMHAGVGIAAAVGLGLVGMNLATHAFSSDDRSSTGRSFLLSSRERSRIEGRIANSYPDPAQAEPWMVQRTYQNRNGHHKFGKARSER